MGDPFTTQWSARIAPIREAQLVREKGGELVRERFAAHTMRRSVKPGQMPVVIAHDESLHVGYVDQVFGCGDGWHWAAFRLDRSLPGAETPAEFVRCGMPVSIGFRTYVPSRTEDTVEHGVVVLDRAQLARCGYGPSLQGRGDRLRARGPGARQRS